MRAYNVIVGLLVLLLMVASASAASDTSNSPVKISDYGFGVLTSQETTQYMIAVGTYSYIGENPVVYISVAGTDANGPYDLYARESPFTGDFQFNPNRVVASGKVPVLNKITGNTEIMKFDFSMTGKIDPTVYVTHSDDRVEKRTDSEPCVATATITTESGRVITVDRPYYGWIHTEKTTFFTKKYEAP